jgi:RIO kinase 1
MFDERRFEILQKKITGERRIRDSDDFKVMDEVFDKRTLLTLYDLLKHERIKSVEFPISTGKEGNVFMALDPKGLPLVLKIYRVTNADFRNITDYIIGDPRFKGISKNKWKLIEAWCKKEFKNLMRYSGCGLPVPRPILSRSNVLLMEYIGNEVSPSPTMKHCPPADAKQAKAWKRDLIEFMVRGYNEAELVHADLSEYNVLIRDGKPVVIDVGQALLKRHPNAMRYLLKDIERVLSYFEKAGVERDGDETELILSRFKEVD